MESKTTKIGFVTTHSHINLVAMDTGRPEPPPGFSPAEAGHLAGYAMGDGRQSPWHRTAGGDRPVTALSHWAGKAQFLPTIRSVRENGATGSRVHEPGG